MTTQRDCLMWFVVLMMGFEASVGTPGVHYHRYMLSDYKRQHNNKTQMDYLPLARPTYPTTDNDLMRKSRFADPMVDMMKSDEKMPLTKLLVRIYNGKEYICMGTFLNEFLVMTSASCLIGVNENKLTMKTASNLMLNNLTVVSGDRVVKMIALHKPMPNMNFTAKFCESPITPNAMFSLSTYIRSTHFIHTHPAIVLPLSECRRLLPDPDGRIVTASTICVKNEKKTDKCQKTVGTPLIYKGQICGVNILGHNCPKYTGVDLYASVLNEAAFLEAKLKIIKAAKLEDILRK